MICGAAGKPTGQVARGTSRRGRGDGCGVGSAADNTPMYRLLALGDIHHYRLAVAPWRLLGKRLVGQLNLYLNRRHQFDRSVLPMASRRIAQLRPDLLLMTGDLTTTALCREFEDVAEQLAPVWATTPTLVLPGNHDRYTNGSTWRRTFERVLASRGDVLAPSYPHMRALNEHWRLLALDAAVPQPWCSRGRLGRRQLRHVESLLADLEPRVGLVVACHYPVVDPPPQVAPPGRWGHRLGRRTALQALLRPQIAKRPVVYIHGHIHRSWCLRLQDGPLAGMVDVNAGALAMARPEHRLGQGFWELGLPDTADGPLTAIHHRCISHDREGWIQTEHEIAPVPAGAAGR
jgi:3',5'-cyclic AMP phosphodiesterase CpdA